MADESKTEEATERRLGQAREEGNTPGSPEASVFATVLAAAIVSMAGILPLGREIGISLGLLWETLGTTSITSGSDIAEIVLRISSAVGMSLALVLVCFTVIGLAAYFSQGSAIASSSRIAFKFSRLSPAQGFARIFGMRNIAQAAKAIVKLTVIVAVLWFVSRREIATITTTMEMELAEALRAMLRMSTESLVKFAVICAVIFGADLAYARYKWRAELRMTKQEVKEDHKSTEGDMHFKARRRFIGRARIRRRILAGVPKATMVIVNPTHYAVALRYIEGDTSAPEVVSKGRDLIALKIKALALELGIPVREDKLLARALHDRVEIGQMIPKEFYKAIAEIIILLRKKAPAVSERA